MCDGSVSARGCSKFKWQQQDSNPQPLVCKQILNHLAKLNKWLRCVLSTYLHGAFDCMFTYAFQSVQVSECTHFKSCCCQLNLKYCTCFEEAVPWYSGNYRVLIKGTFWGLGQFLVNANPFKMMKNAFYFTSKAL